MHIVGERLLDWCGSSHFLHSPPSQKGGWVCLANRFGRNCLVQYLSAYPTRSVFQQARQVTVRYRYPVLIVFGYSDVPAGMPEMVDALDNQGMQCIMFQPGTGENCRVHFGYDHLRRVCLRYGEFGDM